MFATGAVVLPFFSLLTFLIAVPTGIKFSGAFAPVNSGNDSNRAH